MLMHVCCAIDLLQTLFHVDNFIIYFYNPNIYPYEEYVKRKDEVLFLADKYNIRYIESDYDPENFYQSVKGYENYGENSIRCQKCIEERLKATYKKALEIGEKSFSTTLAASRKKDVQMVNSIGSDIDRNGYFAGNFRKGGSQQFADIIIKKLALYRQNYCGCAFSLKKDFS
jgi:predicted adenine nucleotide alpha hydrolase (AANH) superfamily ATPase